MAAKLEGSDTFRATRAYEPGFCCFGITDECMFRCQMCFKWQTDRQAAPRPALPFDAWQRAIRSLKKIVSRPEAFVINFGGGEALLREDVLDVIACAAQEGFITNLASNAWCITPDMARRIADSGLRSINLSLDSLRPEVHDTLRGMPGATEQVKRAIGYLRDASGKLEIGICTVLYDANVDDIMPLMRWVERHDAINWIVFMAAMQPNNTERDDRWFDGRYRYLWPQRQFKVQAVLALVQWLKWWGWKIQNPYHQLRAFQRYFAHPGRFVKHGACNMDRAVHISAAGDIFLCFEHAPIGTIIHDDIADVWCTAQADQVRDAIRHCSRNCHFLLNCFCEREYPFALMRKGSRNGNE